MISVCIPVYNYKIGKLVRSLVSQGERCDEPFEIIVIDDHSSTDVSNQNEAVCRRHTYVRLGSNVGRSRIRNMFPALARYDNLLYIDCDSEIISDDYIDKYLIEIRRGDAPVVCGGRVYNANLPPPAERLRWKYGRERESIPAEARRLSPVRYFMTNNFLINRKVLESVRFDERLTQYGYEDTLFAYSLEKQGVPVKHIDNPLLHACVETNAAFIEKTDRSIANLVSILRYTGHDDGFIGKVRILSVYNNLRRNLAGMAAGNLLALLRPAFRLMLCRRSASLRLFDLYKLGLLFFLMYKTAAPVKVPGSRG